MSSQDFLNAPQFTVTVPAMLADPIDFATGELLSVERGYDPTDAAVFAALRTVRDSGSAVQGFGQKFHEHERIDPQLAPFLQQEVAFALAHLVDDRQVEILSVDILTGDDWAELQVTYSNQVQQAERNVRVRLSEIVSR